MVLFQPVSLIGVQQALTHAYVAHASSGNNQNNYTFAGVSLGTAQLDRSIIAFTSSGPEWPNYCRLDGVNMTWLGPRCFIIAKPTGTTGTFTLNYRLYS